MNNIEPATLTSISPTRRARSFSNYRPPYRRHFAETTSHFVAESTEQPAQDQWLKVERFAFLPSASARHSFAELDKVRLIGQISHDDVIVPDGSEGTIVYRYSGGKAYEVEFVALESIVVTLRDGDIERA